MQGQFKHVRMPVNFLLILIPCIAGFFWLIAYSLFAPRTVLFRKAKQFIAVLAFFFLFGFLSADPHARMMLHFTLFKQVCALAMIPSFISYVSELSGKQNTGIFYKACSILPLVHLIIGIESVYSVGYYDSVRIFVDSYSVNGHMFPYLENNSQIVFYLCYTYIFSFFLLANFMMFAIRMMSCAINGNCKFADVLGFFFKGKKTDIVPVLYLLTLIMLLTIIPALLLGGKCYVVSVPLTFAACFFLAFFLSTICFVGTAGSARRQSIPGLLKTVKFGSSDDEYVSLPSDEPKAADVAPEDRHNQAPVVQFPAYAGAETTPLVDKASFRESFDQEFDKFMKEDRMFLKHDLTLLMAADVLFVEKDVLSDYVDAKYGMSFLGYVNKLRIEYAEQFMLEHDDVTQKEIAYACGFSGASAFNTAFSKLTGTTPKIWKDRYLEMSKRS